MLFSLMALLINSAISSDLMMQEETFREGLQSKSFLTDIITFVPSPTNTFASWVLSLNYISLLDLETGNIQKRVKLTNQIHCIHKVDNVERHLYSLNVLNFKLYKFNLSMGKIEQDLRLPFIDNKPTWISGKVAIQCHPEGLELKVEEDNYFFYKEYSDQQIIKSQEPIKVWYEDEHSDKWELFLAEHTSKKSKYLIVLYNFN